MSQFEGIDYAETQYKFIPNAHYYESIGQLSLNDELRLYNLDPETLDVSRTEAAVDVLAYYRIAEFIERKANLMEYKGLNG